MLDKLTYVNHLNESVVFGENHILIDKNDFRNYEWAYNSQYNKIMGFKRSTSKKTLPVLVYGDDRNTIANRLFEVIEKDVLANKPGKIYAGDYYLTGYFYASQKNDYNDKRFLKVNLTFITTQTKWVNSKSYVFRSYESPVGEDGFDYPFDYPFDYGSPINTQNLINQGFVPSNFIITIYGAVENPTVSIGGDVHKVNVTLGNNEYLTIDSVNKTIVKTARNGSKINEFMNRDLEHYVFEKIKSGSNSVVVNPPCNVDITVLEERSEPAWT